MIYLKKIFISSRFRDYLFKSIVYVLFLWFVIFGGLLLLSFFFDPFKNLLEYFFYVNTLAGMIIAYTLLYGGLITLLVGYVYGLTHINN